MNDTPVRVRLLRDVVTEVGIYRAGLILMATRAPDAWLLHLSLPDRDGTVHLEPVPFDHADCHGYSAGNRCAEAAHEDYRFARACLRYDNEQATAWVGREHGVSLATLRAWGFNTARLEARERSESRSAS